MTTKINGMEYDCRKMVPRDQQQVLRRLAPLLAPIGPSILMLLDTSIDSNAAMANVVQSLGPLTEALSSMPDESFNYVMDACLCHIYRLDRNTASWHPIYIPQGRGAAVRMFQDIDGGLELRLVSEVLRVNLDGFFVRPDEGAASSSGAST